MTRAVRTNAGPVTLRIVVPAKTGSAGRKKNRQARDVHEVVERCGKVSIVRRGLKYWLSYVESGHAVRRPISDDLGAARTAAAQIQAELLQQAPTLLGFSPVAPREYLAAWLDFHEYVRHSSVATIARYRSAAAHFVEYLEQVRVRSLDRLTPEVARGFAKYLRVKPIAPNGHPHTKRRQMKDKTVIFCLEVARSFLNRASRERHMPPYWQNPFSDMRLDNVRVMDAKPITPLTPEEEKRFWEVCDAWSARLFSVIAYSGMRPGEAAALMIDDVDFETGIIQIRNKPAFLIATKTRNVRRVPMTAETRLAVQQAIGNRTAGPVFLMPQWTEQHQPELAAATPDALAAKFARFIDTERERLAAAGVVWNRARHAAAAKRSWKQMGGIRAQDVRKAYMRVMAKAGSPQRTCPKDFRHSWATSLQAANTDPFARKEMLGHTELLQTSAYTHTGVETLQREVERARNTRVAAIPALQAALAR